MVTQREQAGGFRPLAGMNCFRWKPIVIEPPIRFPSPCGDELFHRAKIGSSGDWGFRPLAGMNCFMMNKMSNFRQIEFPSPCGDELFRASTTSRCSGRACFRPLAGMNCFIRKANRNNVWRRFRPLAGMNCFTARPDMSLWIAPFPSPCGDELFQAADRAGNGGAACFRPLAGMNCFFTDDEGECSRKGFPSPCVDELFRLRRQ